MCSEYSDEDLTLFLGFAAKANALAREQVGALRREAAAGNGDPMGAAGP